ncbi:hypothetical protein HO173_006208 [Letharia columbiana]|nr:uncharacterized protein HO173_006208 [Letharia columbiana]KAF6235525.1 hypothetical protein HO173_006208 [Letharia columbiana]
MVITKSRPALRSAPIPGAGVVRKSKHTMNNNTTIFRLLKVPKYAKRTVATMCEKKNETLMEELGRLKKDWMQQETEIEWLKKELERAKGELKAIKGRDSKETGYETMHGWSKGLSRTDEEDLEALWACYGGR